MLLEAVQGQNNGSGITNPSVDNITTMNSVLSGVGSGRGHHVVLLVPVVSCHPMDNFPGRDHIPSLKSR